MDDAEVALMGEHAADWGTSSTKARSSCFGTDR
jgi:hypothetical protein